MEPNNEITADKTTKPEAGQQNELLLAQLLSMGFEDSMCIAAVKLTNDQERAIELILSFQEEKEKKGTFSEKRDDVKNIQGMDNPFDVLENIRESYKMVALVRTDLGMGTGKIAAQVGHAVLGAYQGLINTDKPEWNEDLDRWEETGNAKIVLKVKSKEDLIALAKKAREIGLNTYTVADAGRTQIEPGSLTVCAIGPANSRVIDSVTGHLKLM